MRLILINLSAWVIFYVVFSLAYYRLPELFFSANSPLDGLFKERKFENKGKFWRQQFYIHRWKEYLPDGSNLLNMDRDSHLPEKGLDSIKFKITETKRSELMHWSLIVISPYFFIWNPVWSGWAMIIFSLITNGAFVMIQRYDRVRLYSIQTRMKNMIKKGAVYR